ncbi:MAG: hypothetical protein GX811_03515, partial [Lentisphaerae bacterium]|nr:hypothetical protein [Lentisphaerota bacterium]
MKIDKKLIVFVLAIMLLLSACSPTPATSEEPQGEPTNVEATAETTDDEADDTKQPEETPTEAEETPTEAEETPDEPDVSEDSDLKLQGPF